MSVRIAILLIVISIFSCKKDIPIRCEGNAGIGQLCSKYFWSKGSLKKHEVYYYDSTKSLEQIQEFKGNLLISTKTHASEIIGDTTIKSEKIVDASNYEVLKNSRAYWVKNRLVKYQNLDTTKKYIYVNNLLEKEECYFLGNSLYYVNYKYNSSQKLVNVTTYNSDNIKIKELQFNYFSEDKEEVATYIKGVKENSELRIYDSSKRLVKVLRYSSGNKLVSDVRYTYGIYGIELVDLYVDTEINERIELRYNVDK